MTRMPIEVADVLRLAGGDFLQAERSYLSQEQLRAVRDLLACRTAALGGHVDACNACGQQRIPDNRDHVEREGPTAHSLSRRFHRLA